MSSDQTPIDKTPEWQALALHHAMLRDVHLRDLFASDPDRADSMMAEGAGIFLDYSKHRATPDTIELLVKVAAGGRRRGAAGGDVRGRAHQHDRGSARSSTRPCVRPRASA